MYFEISLRDFLEAMSDLSSSAAERGLTVLVKSAAPGAPR
jgi:hypothetical protein